MSFKDLKNTYVASGYTLAAKYDGLTIESTATIAGSGVMGNSSVDTINNSGVVNALGGQVGVRLTAGGTITNALAGSISGGFGVDVSGGSGTVDNYGAIHGVGFGYGYGVWLSNGGKIVNGSATDITASITSGDAYTNILIAGGVGTITNFGSITSSNAAWGVLLQAGGMVTNGAANDATALIEGGLGVDVSGAGTVTNFATIAGDGGVAVTFKSASDVLVVEAGSVFQGSINGGGGTLELAGGTGTLTGLLAGGNVTVSGSMATTTFGNFATVKIDAGASFALSGSGATITAGQSLIDAGALSGTGALALTGGSATFNTGASLNIASVTLSGASKATVNTNVTYAGKWTQSAGTLSVGGGATMSFVGAADSFAGTAANAGVVGIIGVTATIGTGGLSLTGTGHVLMTDSSLSEITGATPATTLTVGQVLEGAGKLGAGKLTLMVQATGVIAAVGSNALTLDTGTATIANAGIIETVGTTGATVVSAINNSGRLEAYTSTLTIDGAVTGSGFGDVANGTLKFAATSTFNQNVVFSGSKGTLELAHGQTYSGTISGFSKTGGTFLDLDDVKFTSAGEATYSAATHILTVNDGMGHIASIHLAAAAYGSFVAASDGHGGTVIHDPAKTPVLASVPLQRVPVLPTHAFVQAMAGLGRAGAGPPDLFAMESRPWDHSLLAAARS